MKHLFHIVFFLAGLGLGIWWGANHPQEASAIAQKEQDQAARVQAAVSQARIDLLQRFISSKPDDADTASDAGYKRMLDDEKTRLADANQKLGK